MSFLRGRVKRSPHSRRHHKCGQSLARRRPLRCERLEVRRLLIAEGAEFVVGGSYDAGGLVGSISGEIRWGDGTTSSATVSDATATGNLRIRFDYSLDTNGFFSGANASRRNLLQLAGDSLIKRFGDDLAAITPGGLNDWEPSIFHPSSGPANQLVGTLTPLPKNMPVAANEIIIYAGSRDLPGSSRGVGGQSSFRFPSVEITCQTQAECDQKLAAIEAFRDVVRGRGEPGALASPQTDMAPQIGSVSFDSATDWHFGTYGSTIQSGQVDFFSVAVHEIAHVLGFGITRPNVITPWAHRTTTGRFDGAASRAAYDGAGSPPVQQNHWSPTILSEQNQRTLMAAEIETGRQQPFAALDFAAMDDMGWDLLSTQVTVSASHRFADDGVYPAELVLRGSSAGELVYPLGDVSVTNVAPTLNVPGTQEVILGQTLSVPDIGVLTDPGFRNLQSDPTTSETFTYSINWGDGSELTEGTATIDRQGNSSGVPTAASFDGSHTYQTNGVKTVTITATDDDGGTVQRSLSVIVSLPPVLTLELNRTAVNEDQGANAATLTIRRSGPATGTNQTITLVSNDISEATVPPTAVIPADATFTTVPVNVVDDALLDGDVVVLLSAEGSLVDGDDIELLVRDREEITASFSTNELREDAALASMTVRRSNTDTTEELVVAVSGGNASELDVPASVTIPANQQQVTVSVAPVNDDDPEPAMRLNYAFTAAAYLSGTAEINLIDDEPPKFQNALSRYDVNNSGETTAGDALRVINALARRGGPSALNPETEETNGVFFDVNGDYRITALDALVIINELARLQNAIPVGAELVVQPVTSLLSDSREKEDRDLELQLLDVSRNG